MSNEIAQPAVGSPPHLWNPRAASLWSLLLTPAFGAYLHAQNWRTLGDIARAKANMLFVWATLAFLAVNLATLFLPDNQGLDQVMKFAGLGILIAWAMTQGRFQITHVKETLGDVYVKKSWAKPLAIGFIAVAAYIGIIAAIVLTYYQPDATALAEQLKPLILEQWHKQPGTQDAAIEHISLEHKEGKKYSGAIDATFGGKPERMSLEVELNGASIGWQVQPIANK